MGGFAVILKNANLNPENGGRNRSQRINTENHGVRDGEESIRESDSVNHESSHSNPSPGNTNYNSEDVDSSWGVTTSEGRTLITPEQFIIILPNVAVIPHENDLLALSQKDKLTKFLALVQCTSFVMTFVARLEQGLPTSILEFSTLAYATCAVFAYAFWWSKPGTIMTSPFVLYPKPMSMHGLQSEFQDNQGIIPILFTKLNGMPRGLRICITAIVPFAFCGIHIPPAISRTSFPTTTEWWIWQFSLAVIIVFSLFILNLECFEPQFWTKKFKASTPLTLWDRGLFWLVFLATIVCALCRFYMVVAAFRQLFYLSSDAFKVPSWSKYLPRFS